MTMGRPTKLTEEIKNKIIAAVRGGNYIETAAAFAGIHKSTLYDWMHRGQREIEFMLANNKKAPRKAEAIYVDFSDALEQALTESEMLDVAAIQQARDWKARAWHLERRFPHRWGKNDKLTLDGNMEHDHKGEVNVKHDIFADIDQYADVLREAAARRLSTESDAGTDSTE